MMWLRRLSNYSSEGLYVPYAKNAAIRKRSLRNVPGCTEIMSAALSGANEMWL